MHFKKYRKTHNRKLSDINIEYIKDELFKKNKTQTELALYFNVCIGVIGNIKRQNTYKNVF
jgi:fructose-1,6-bisphosphatase